MPYLTKQLLPKVLNHIMENCREKGIYLQAINGYTDHIHCLISLDKEQTIAKVVQLIKGESSNWINKNQLTKQKFMWQDDYFAVSVSESQYEKVANYIKIQEQHHTKKSFSDEVDEFMRKYRWEKENKQSFLIFSFPFAEANGNENQYELGNEII